MKEKTSKQLGKVIACIVLEKGENFEDWHKSQREDPSILIILCGKEVGKHPARTEIAFGDVSTQIYWLYWNTLVLKDYFIKNGKSWILI